MSKTNWKNYEKKVAEFFNGNRISTGKIGEEVPDVETNNLIIECKTRKNIPTWLFSMLEQIEKHRNEYNKVPVVVLHQDSQRIENDLVIMRASQLKQLIKQLQTKDVGLELRVKEAIEILNG